MKITIPVGVRTSLERIRDDAQLRHPGRTLERAMSYLHRPTPDPDTANALALLGKAWASVKRTQ